MRKITITTASDGYKLEEMGHQSWHEYDGISIDFILDFKYIPEKEYLLKVISLTKEFGWINVEDNTFIFDLEEIKRNFNVFSGCKWMKGYITLKPNYEPALDDSKFIVSFSATKKEIEINSPKKIFLSHKGADKPLVREYFQILKELGFDPWLDEDAMAAGTKLNRGIYQGFKESCAAIFFVTPSFKDEDYLEDEVDYAIDEQKEKGDKFAIITLALKDLDGKTGEIPGLLRKYVYKEPSSQLEAFREIIRALPLETGKKVWKN
ncbi:MULTISPECIES: toll/interleukin-1 receptor domain-containing protein [Bacillus]|uniref:toll/interleukin-1 receptor domain-containing protein n=1 Tax=Bacillus TaxID=1386 RepID=UPI0013625310|nr:MULTISPECIES: toll/interleukin-1 receptor domain-containing protein [Bacillus]MBU8724237.1 toll/interleukin-1 receptor domain-containing protein [Bacillus subtilis]MCL0027216.1 toll/interleukin-1 receptor domain-containing protein [Bacillus sp. C21]MCL8471781.1 toll/interleukin-1 receptor domain-containing protein [Bacillus subtilis]MCM3011073.1 toll/interleukin-1 receptor domain-containing protein [Bacillus subtilis]MDK8209605.1 toll/interleukin-1 receptor domain-containing protein [Bacill